MNFIKASQSGKPFKRASDPHYYTRTTVTLTGPGGSTRAVGPDDLLATDWELEEPMKLIRKSELERAIEAVKASGGSIDDVIGEIGLR